MPLSSKVESFTELLWIVAINDFMLKYIAVISKIVIVLCPPYVLAYRKRVRDLPLHIVHTIEYENGNTS